MNIRPTQSSIFSLVNRGLAFNLSKLASSQEHVATGKRILRPSDDAVGTGRSLSIRRRMALLERYAGSIDNSRPILESSTAALESASGILSEARALLITSMSGSVSETDRQAMGLQIELVLENLMDVANTKSGDRFVFGGTTTDRQPYELSYSGGEAEVMYFGNDNVQHVSIGFGTELALNVPGSSVFGSNGVKSIDLSGLTGVGLGTSAQQGSGFSNIDFRHNATVGTLGSGLAFANGGTQDTILGDHTLTIDSVAGTLQLGQGTPVQIPQATDSDYTNFAVQDENGAAVYLDFSAYDGTDSVSSLTGEGSVSLDGSSYTSVDFTETDLELVSPDGETILHLDTTGVRRAGEELVSFSGATDLFSVLAGAARDLRNDQGLNAIELVERLDLRLNELDRNFDQSLKALGTLGARTARLNETDSRIESMNVSVQSLLSDVEDVDISAVILEMNQAEQTLQLAQMSGSRLIQHTLLDFLR